MKRTDWLALSGLLLVILAWLTNWYFVSHVFKDPGAQGQFGDMFGATTSLFSGLTIVGLIYTILLQRDDLNITREGLNIQREELAATRAELSEQNRTLKMQRFESTFFNMIALFNSMRATFYNKNQFETFHNNILGEKTVMRGITNLEGLRNLYNQNNPSINTNARTQFGQYINSLETMVDLILTTKRSEPARSKYFKIFFGQLTNLERIVLLYHFNLASKPKHFDDFKTILFEPLREANEVWTPHSRMLDGIDWAQSSLRKK